MRTESYCCSWESLRWLDRPSQVSFLTTDSEPQRCSAFLKNLTHSFDVSFYVMGALMTLSGAISLPLRAINRWELSKNGKTDGAEMQPLRQETA